MGLCAAGVAAEQLSLDYTHTYIYSVRKFCFSETWRKWKAHAEVPLLLVGF